MKEETLSYCQLMECKLELEAQVKQLAAESAGMSSFVEALLAISWSGGSADGAEIQELALKLGLIRKEVYSQDEHETLVDDPGNFEDGDAVYFRVETPDTDAFISRLRNEVRAEGAEMCVRALVTSDDDDFEDAPNICAEVARLLREGKAGEVVSD